jgi:hypothetical protein
LSGSIIDIVLLLLGTLSITAVEQDVADDIIAFLLAILFSDTAISLFPVADAPFGAPFAIWTE